MKSYLVYMAFWDGTFDSYTYEAGTIAELGEKIFEYLYKEKLGEPKSITIYPF